MLMIAWARKQQAANTGPAVANHSSVGQRAGASFVAKALARPRARRGMKAITRSGTQMHSAGAQRCSRLERPSPETRRDRGAAPRSAIASSLSEMTDSGGGIRLTGVDPRESPYATSPGAPPPCMAGREKLLESFDVTLHRLEHGKSATAPMLSGAPGMGKTVVLNEFVRISRERGWFTAVDEVGPTTRLPKLVAMLARDVLLEMSSRRRLTARVQRALGVLKAFTGVKAFGIELSIDATAVPGPADTGDLARDLRGLFDELGTQRGLPIAFVPCGLFPSWRLSDSDERRPGSYVPRMFAPSHSELEPLSEAESRRALVEPVTELGVEYVAEAIDAVIEFCEGNPWLLQVVGSIAWEQAPQSPISLEAVMEARSISQGHLDDSFFPRLLRDVTAPELRVLTALAHSTLDGPAGVRFLWDIGDEGREALETLVDLNLVSNNTAGVALTVARMPEFLRRRYPTTSVAPP